MKRIPKRFELLNHVIEVVVIPASRWKHDDWAYWDYEHTRILVCGGKKSVVHHSFWHEVAHALLAMTGRHGLSNDEVLVDSLGGLMAQMMRTAE